MTTTVNVDAHTTAIVAALNATTVDAGDGDPPSGVGWQGAEGNSNFVPYFVVHWINGAFGGPVADAEADLEGVWQVTSVGADRKQSQQVADLARATLRAAGALTVANRGGIHVSCEPGGTRQDAGVKPPVWVTTDRYRITSHPS